MLHCNGPVPGAAAFALKRVVCAPDVVAEPAASDFSPAKQHTSDSLGASPAGKLVRRAAEV